MLSGLGQETGVKMRPVSTRPEFRGHAVERAEPGPQHVRGGPEMALGPFCCTTSGRIPDETACLEQTGLCPRSVDLSPTKEEQLIIKHRAILSNEETAQIPPRQSL